MPRIVRHCIQKVVPAQGFEPWTLGLEGPALPTELNGPGPDSNRGSSGRRTGAAADTTRAPLPTKPDHRAVLLGEAHADGRWRRRDEAPDSGDVVPPSMAMRRSAAPVPGNTVRTRPRSCSPKWLSPAPSAAPTARGARHRRRPAAPTSGATPVRYGEARSRPRANSRAECRAFPGVIDANHVGMNGWAMTARPPASWMAVNPCDTIAAE